MKTNISGFDIEGTPAEIYEFIQLGLKDTIKESEPEPIVEAKKHIGRPKKSTNTIVYATSPQGVPIIFSSIRAAERETGLPMYGLYKALKKYGKYENMGWHFEHYKGNLQEDKKNGIKVIEKKKHLQHRVKLTDTKGISVICQSIYDCAKRIGASDWTISRNLKEKGFYKTNAWLVEPYIPTHSNQL